MSSCRTTDRRPGHQLRNAACRALFRPNANRILALDFDVSGRAISMWAADEGSTRSA
jgi:hypothetical protein